MIVDNSERRTPPLSVECLTDPSHFSLLQDAWDAVDGASRFPSVFSTWLWSDAWWRTLLGARDDVLRIFVFRDRSGQIQGIAPFHRFCGYERDGVRVPGREMLPLGYAGRRQEGLTEEPSLLAVAGREPEVAVAVADALLKMPAREWDYARFSLHYEPEPVGATELSGCRRGANLRRVVRDGAARRELPEDWKALRKSLSRSMRDNTSYYPRLLQRHGHDFRVRRVDTPEAVRAAVPTLVALHRLRAAPTAAGTPHLDHLPGPLQERFLLEALPRFAQTGRAYLLIGEVAGAPVAAQAFFLHRGVLTFYYSGFDTEWHAYSPLLILAQAALEDAMARGVTAVDLLPKPALWKSRWGAEPVGGIEEVRINRITPPALLRSARLAVARHLSPRAALL